MLFLLLKHFPAKACPGLDPGACPGLDPGWIPVRVKKTCRSVKVDIAGYSRTCTESREIP